MRAEVNQVFGDAFKCDSLRDLVGNGNPINFDTLKAALNARKTEVEEMKAMESAKLQARNRIAAVAMGKQVRKKMGSVRQMRGAAEAGASKSRKMATDEAQDEEQRCRRDAAKEPAPPPLCPHTQR